MQVIFLIVLMFPQLLALVALVMAQLVGIAVGQGIRVQRLAGSSTFGRRLIRCLLTAQQMVYSIR
jgi:hypothetical protein